MCIIEKRVRRKHINYHALMTSPAGRAQLGRRIPEPVNAQPHTRSPTTQCSVQQQQQQQSTRQCRLMRAFRAGVAGGFTRTRARCALNKTFIHYRHKITFQLNGCVRACVRESVGKHTHTCINRHKRTLRSLAHSPNIQSGEYIRISQPHWWRYSLDYEA